MSAVEFPPIQPAGQVMVDERRILSVAKQRDLVSIGFQRNKQTQQSALFSSQRVRGSTT
jgi:hypothetical protein